MSYGLSQQIKKPIRIQNVFQFEFYDLSLFSPVWKITLMAANNLILKAMETGDIEEF